eukprot:17426-Pyramimonas_sp.AAC.2
MQAANIRSVVNMCVEYGGPQGERITPCSLTTDQSDAGGVGIFSQRTNQTQKAWVYSHNQCQRSCRRDYGATDYVLAIVPA